MPLGFMWRGVVIIFALYNICSNSTLRQSTQLALLHMCWASICSLFIFKLAIMRAHHMHGILGLIGASGDGSQDKRLYLYFEPPRTTSINLS